MTKNFLESDNSNSPLSGIHLDFSKTKNNIEKLQYYKSIIFRLFL